MIDVVCFGINFLFVLCMDVEIVNNSDYMVIILLVIKVIFFEIDDGVKNLM